MKVKKNSHNFNPSPHQKEPKGVKHFLLYKNVVQDFMDYGILYQVDCISENSIVTQCAPSCGYPPAFFS